MTIKAVLLLLCVSIVGCSPVSLDLGTSAAPQHAMLVSRAWRVTEPAGPAPGSIYIFLSNGTLLETSCVETYRIATWKADPQHSSTLQVFEDQQLAFTAAITSMTGDTLHLQQNLIRSKESRTLTLKSLDREFVCPDLRK